MNSGDKVGTILFSLLIIGIVTIVSELIYTNHVQTQHYITEGYQKCYILGHGTEWLKECNSQIVMEKR